MLYVCELAALPAHTETIYHHTTISGTRNHVPHKTEREGSRIFFSEEGTGFEVHEGDRSLLEFYIRCSLVRRMGITRDYTTNILYSVDKVKKR